MPAWRSLIVALLITTPLAADELTVLGGKSYTGTLSSINDSVVRLRTADGLVEEPLSKVLLFKVGMPKQIAGSPEFDEVRLVDGTVFRCGKMDFLGDDLDVTLLSGAKLKFPFRLVESIIRQAQQGDMLKKFNVIAAEKVRKDRVVILRGGQLNAVAGVLSTIDAKAQTIKFTSESGASVNLPLSRVHGMVFYRLDASTDTPICKVVDIHGDTIMASKLQHDGSNLGLITPFGAKFAMAGENLVKLDFNLGKLSFLSDLEPTKVVEKSGIGLINRYQKDTNLDGDSIKLDKEYAKGISLHAYTELEYNLGGNYKTLKAVLGVDTRTGSESRPIVSIYCDGVRKFSEVVSAEKTLPIAIDVNNVNVLRIEVRSQNILDLHDHVTFADARVSQ